MTPDLPPQGHCPHISKQLPRYLHQAFFKMSVSRRGVNKNATLTDLPADVQQNIYTNLPPTQIASLATLTRSTTSIVQRPSLWSEISHRHLNFIPENPSAATIRALADSLVCRWWLLTGLFVPGIPVHRRSGFCEVSARGGIELPIVHAEKESCYVFGGQHEAAAIPVINPSVSLCFFLDSGKAFPVDGMRLALVHTTEIPDDGTEPDLMHLTLGPSVRSDHENIKTEVPYATITVRVNNKTLLQSFRPKHGNFQVTHVNVPANILVTKPRMNHISVDYDRSSTASYWLKDVSIMPSILPPPAEEKLVPSIRIGEPLPQPQPERPAVSQPASPPSGRRQSQNQTHHHRRPVRRLAEHSFKLQVCETHAVARYQKGHHASPKPKHVYHHNYFRSPRRSSPTSPKARSAR